MSTIFDIFVQRPPRLGAGEEKGRGILFLRFILLVKPSLRSDYYLCCRYFSILLGGSVILSVMSAVAYIAGFFRALDQKRAGEIADGN